MSEETNGDLQVAFDAIRNVNPYGQEYWSMRDLAPLLGYEHWERVPVLVERARAACRNAGQTEDDHFRASSKMITVGKGAQREVEDYRIARKAAAPLGHADGRACVGFSQKPVAFAVLYIGWRMPRSGLLEFVFNLRRAGGQQRVG